MSTKKFAKFAEGGVSMRPVLPVAHTTDWETLVGLIEVNPTLNATPCPVFKEALLYLFYGRPSFRKHANVEPVSMALLHKSREGFIS